MKFDVVFESSKSHGYVRVLHDSSALRGFIATQDAGSSNKDIYYQVGGGGVNKLFADDMGQDLTAAVNKALITAYENRFGDGAWEADKKSSSRP